MIQRLGLTYVGILILMIASFSASTKGKHQAGPTCRFAEKFPSSALLTSAAARSSFAWAVVSYETGFLQPFVGVDATTGMTFDGQRLFPNGTIDPAGLHFWSAASKESLHLSMLAIALVAHGPPSVASRHLPHWLVTPPGWIEEAWPGQAWLVSIGAALDILERKLDTLEQFDRAYPGFGGFLPWYFVKPGHIVPADEWKNRVPALDNGQFIWGLVAVKQALLETAAVSPNATFVPRATALSARLTTRLELIAHTALTIFYCGQGSIRSIALIHNTSVTPFPGNYETPPDCHPCFLDDPYEGELMTMFLFLYTSLPEAERQLLWKNKRAKLVPLNFSTPQGDLLVQQGFWFSSHEQWKYLFLPYQRSLSNRFVFLNGERARSWNAQLHEFPGLFASVTAPMDPQRFPGVPNYLSACGIPELASQRVDYENVVTPYGSFPLLLASPPHGLAFLSTMLQAPLMQNLFGSSESVNSTGTTMAGLLTWDAKVTTLLALSSVDVEQTEGTVRVGGVASLLEACLETDGVLAAFDQIVESEWSRVFNVNETGPQQVVPFGVPTAKVPTSRLPLSFSTCT